MLTLWRRHGPGCKHTSRTQRRCSCPIWIEGTAQDGRTVKPQSLKTRLWADAERKKARLEGGALAGRRLAVATEDFIKDTERRKLTRNVLAKWRRLFKRMNSYAVENGLQDLQSWTVQDARKFAATWGLAASTERAEIERCRQFFRFAIASGWTDSNPWTAVKPPKQTAPPTMPFDADEMRRILAACDPMERALVLLIRATGLRIGDACRLAKKSVQDGKLLLRTAKTGVPIWAPLPKAVLDALDGFPHARATHYFWSGEATADSIRNIWSERVAAVCAKAGIADSTMKAHRLRDTFAVEALLRGVPIDVVSVMLGHASLKTTEKHYAPWIQARQNKLEEQMRATWADEPAFNEPYNSPTTVN